MPRILNRHLSAQGYQVLTAPGVPEAIALLESTPVQLVITDLKMPKVSGLDLVQHVRENCKWTGVMVRLWRSGGANAGRLPRFFLSGGLTALPR